MSDDDLRAHGASPEIIHKLRQATTIDRVLEVVDAEAPHLEHIILDTLSATEGSVLEIAAKAREADVLRKQVRSLQDQQQHDQLRAADLTQQLDGERSRGVTLDTELQQLRQQAPSPKADARIFQLAHEVEVNRRNLDTLEQRLRDTELERQSMASLLEDSRMALKRSENFRMNPDLEWSEGYPGSFAEVAAYAYESLQEQRGSFQFLHHPQHRAKGTFGEIFAALGTGSGSPVRAVKLPLRGYSDVIQLERAWRSEEAMARRIRNRSIHGIVRVEQVAPVEYPGFIVYEWIDANSLAERLAKGPMAVAPAIELVAALSNTLQILNEQSIWFSDLHAGNVMLQHGKPLLIDPAACVPVHSVPPEWRGTKGKLPHEMGSTADFQRGQTFMLAHLLLRCISLPEELHALPAVHVTTGSSEWFSSLACLMNVRESDNHGQQCVARVTDQLRIACERSGEVLAPEQIATLLCWALDDNLDNRPMLATFAQQLRASM